MGRDRGFQHDYGCSIGSRSLAFRQRCWGSPRGHDGGGYKRYVALCARSWWIVVFFRGVWDTRLPIESPFLLLRRPLSSTSVSPRDSDALPALARHGRWRRGRPSACVAGRTPSLPSRHRRRRRGRSAGCVAGGTPPLPPRGARDGGADDLRHVPWGVLPLSLSGCGRRRRGFCSLGRGAYPPPFSLQARATAARAFYGLGRGAYSSSSLSGCRRRQRRRSAPCAVGRTPPFPLGVRATAERTDALPRVPSRGLGTAWDPSPSVSTETGSGSAGLTPQERDDAAPPASAGPLRGREGTEEREVTYARRMQVSLRADDLGNVARGRWRRWWRRRSSPVASAAAGDAAAAGATAEDRGVSR